MYTHRHNGVEYEEDVFDHRCAAVHIDVASLYRLEGEAKRAQLNASY